MKYKELFPDVPDLLGNVVIYNPYHAELDDAEIDILTQSGDLKIYCAEGDMVSSIFNQEDFNDCTKYIYIDTETIINSARQEVIEERGTIVSDYMEPIVDVAEFLKLDVGDLREQLETFNYIELMFHRGTHNIWSSLANKDVSFNADGSVRDTIILENGETYTVDGMTHKEASELIYGFDMKERLQSLVDTFGTVLDKKIVELILSDKEAFLAAIDTAQAVMDSDYGNAVIYGGKTVSEIIQSQAPGYDNILDGTKTIVLKTSAATVESFTCVLGQVVNIGEYMYGKGKDLYNYLFD